MSTAELTKLIRVLQAAGVQATGIELAEAIWVAQHLSPAPPSRPEPVPAAPVRGLQRALQPLRQQVPSHSQTRLDEPATAEHVAATGIWAPVVRPLYERRFDVVLAFDGSPSMALWHDLETDLRKVLAQTGAFRDIRVCRLRPNNDGCSIQFHRESAPRSPRELLDASGRRLFLLVTDGGAAAWMNRPALETLEAWARSGPTAILQPLPERMWTRGLLPVYRSRITSRRVGSANNALNVAHRRGRPSGLTVPILGLEPVALASWAALVAGPAANVALAVTSTAGSPAISDEEPTDESPHQRLSRFRISSSPLAYRLAVCLAAVPLNLPVMRLVQRVAVPESEISTLAEVLLGGLLVRTGNGTYEFTPGVRDALLDDLRRTELAAILSTISGHFTDDAWLPPEVATRFGAVARRLSGTWQRHEGPSGTWQRHEESSSTWQHYERPSVGETGFVPDWWERGPVTVVLPSARGWNQAAGNASTRPEQLSERDQAELARLIDFCRSDDGYLWLQSHEGGTITALLSSLAKQPPQQLRSVSFFITGQPRQAHSGIFALDLTASLAKSRWSDPPEDLVHVPMPNDAQRSLIASVFGEDQNSGEHLVLIVDGIDLDTGPPAFPSIASVLPNVLGRGVHVIVSAAPGWRMPSDVPPDHPVRNCSLRNLTRIWGTTELPGSSLLAGRYRLVEHLGAGNMSVIWHGFDEALGRSVAVKVLPLSASSDPDLRRRLRVEAQTTAAIRHPRIPAVYEYGEVMTIDGEPMPYMVMEKVDGESLAAVLARTRRLPWLAAIRLASEVAAALAAAHDRGIVHRDVTPANVMMTNDGANLLDFGASGIVGDNDADEATGGVVGTPAYLAPERLENGLVTPAIDVYSLGLVLYRTLVGQIPWDVGSTTALLRAHQYHEPEPLPQIEGLPPAVATLIERCLEKRPDDRPSMSEVAQVLDECSRRPDVFRNGADPIEDDEATVQPVYVLGDESASIAAYLPLLNGSLRMLCSKLADHPALALSVYISLVGFSNDAQQRLPLTRIDRDMELPEFIARGGTEYGPAFAYLQRKLTFDLRSLADRGLQVLNPLVLFLTGEEPTDRDWDQSLRRLMESQQSIGAPVIVAVGVGEVSPATLVKVASQPAYALTAPSRADVSGAVSAFGDAIVNRMRIPQNNDGELVITPPRGFSLALEAE